ncbi:nucleoside hydrolase [Solimonas flava]|uniref:nucleoside hydrolase n=1 Tax=Solimonas flava TaxID=415849 RepID=UPI00040952FB|nr:nucleoside hydrolase [Solimonas flava]
MKRLLIDTDTAGDDVTSLLFGLLWPGVQLDAIFTVMGNVPLELCTRNALTALDHAGRSGEVPVFAGCDRPLMRPPIHSDFVHGKDGMGNSFFVPPRGKAEPLHAAQALVRFVNAAPGEYEIVAHGPLTNLAVAYMLDPSIVHKIKKLWIMGGACHFQGNITPAAEYNVYADPEAARMVFRAGFPIVMVGWEICCRYGIVGGEDLAALQAIDTPLARFYHQINSAALKFNRELGGLDGISHPDSQTTAICINPAILQKSGRYFVEVECQSNQMRGYTAVDTRFHPEPNEFWQGGEPNAEVVHEVDYHGFYRMLSALLKGDFSEYSPA